MLYNELLRNTTLSTDYGIKDVDEIGVVKGLTKTQEKEISNLRGFIYKEDAKQEQKKETTTNTAKEKQDDKKEEPKSKTTKKTTATKSSTAKTSQTKQSK